LPWLIMLSFLFLNMDYAYGTVIRRVLVAVLVFYFQLIVSRFLVKVGSDKF